jgi:RNA-directed DNA polymerase
MCADISSFFTRISKSRVTEIVDQAVKDDEFVTFFRSAINVELNNLANLREHASRFPTGEIGVAQGSSLSPFLGNIVLSEFDQEMNTGDCRCIRYIDDFIILAPTAKAASARLRKARSILATLGMECAPGKTSGAPIPATDRIEFLGIELHNGLIRPALSARTRFLGKVKAAFDEGRKALINYQNGQPLPKTNSLLGTFRRVDGVVQGWGKHYRFCNDIRCFENLDTEIGSMIRDYLGRYRDARHAAPEARRSAMLGIELLGAINRAPLVWPRSPAGRTAR